MAKKKRKRGSRVAVVRVERSRPVDAPMVVLTVSDDTTSEALEEVCEKIRVAMPGALVQVVTHPGAPHYLISQYPKEEVRSMLVQVPLARPGIRLEGFGTVDSPLHPIRDLVDSFRSTGTIPSHHEKEEEHDVPRS